MLVDARFYEKISALMPVGDLAVALGCGFHGDPNVSLDSFAPLDKAGPASFTFFDGKPKETSAIPKGIGACFIRESNLDLVPEGAVGLSCAKPRYTFARACELFARQRRIIGPEAIDPSAEIGMDVTLGPGVVIGASAIIGAGTYIGPNTVIGPGVVIGENCQLGANSSIFCAEIGNNLNALAGVRIGEAGYGLSATEDGYYDTPHYGRVIIGNNCTLGANMTIDRAVFGDTIIGDGNKFDNMVHIAHNCHLGKNFRAAAQTGVAGSCKIGDNVSMGGQVGTGDHLTLGNNSTIMAFSGLMHDVPAGAYWGGAPAKPTRTFWREMAWLAKNAKRKKKTAKEEEGDQ